MQRATSNPAPSPTTTRARIDRFFASLDDGKRPDVMREIRSRGNCQDEIKFCLEQATTAGA